MQDLAAGGVDIVTCSVPEARAMIEANRAKSLAIMAPERAIAREAGPRSNMLSVRGPWVPGLVSGLKQPSLHSPGHLRPSERNRTPARPTAVIIPAGSASTA